MLILKWYTTNKRLGIEFCNNNCFTATFEQIYKTNVGDNYVIYGGKTLIFYKYPPYTSTDTGK